jgi:hypothetical protein
MHLQLEIQGALFPVFIPLKAGCFNSICDADMSARSQLDAGYPILRRVPAMMAALENLAKRNQSRIQNEVKRAASSQEGRDDVDEKSFSPKP